MTQFLTLNPGLLVLIGSWMHMLPKLELHVFLLNFQRLGRLCLISPGFVQVYRCFLLTFHLYLSGHPPESKIKRFYSWFCGYEAGTEEAKQAAHEQHERLATLTSLERNPLAETFLNINMIIILAVGLYLYLYFSI